MKSVRSKSDCRFLQEHDRPVYTSEAAARFSLMRDSLQSAAREYVSELLNLLGKLPKNKEAKEDPPKAAAQEEYNLALFNELGIGVTRNSDKVCAYPWAGFSFCGCHRKFIPSKQFFLGPKPLHGGRMFGPSRGHTESRCSA